MNIGAFFVNHASFLVNGNTSPSTTVMSAAAAVEGHKADKVTTEKVATTTTTATTSTVPGSSPVKQNRQLWWRKSVIRRSTSSIEPEMDKIVAKSPFLQQHAAVDKFKKGIALFNRHEITTGQLLGKGGFSFVYEVKGFRLDPEVSSHCSDEEQALREAYVASAYNEKTGQYNYCIKHLQERLLDQPKDFLCAATDLAVEAAFMTALDHPNILKIRGLPMDDLQAWDDGNHDGFFIITDRLESTLDKNVVSWRNTVAPTLRTRCSYALDLANALRYLHQQRIIFRDLKPHNIGFTRNGEVKLFDFGLCRELPSTCARENCGGGINTSSNEMFIMSGVGTRRYMACEIINTGRYNLKADVYSWAMIFWEILNLRKPYAPYSTEDHRREVCHGGERPHIQPEWPNWIQSILRMSWEDTVEYRFSMDEVYENLRVAMCHQWEHYDAVDVPSRKVVLNSRYPDDQPGSPTAVSSIDSEFYLTLPKLAQLRSASLSYDSELQIEVEECLTAIEVHRR